MSNGKNRELDKQYYTIYKVTNLIDSKIYIGFHSTNDLYDGYMGSGKYIKRAISKHGVENFEKEILFVYDNQKEAEEKEAELVNEEFVSRTDTYNLTVGGNVCILRGEDNGFYGKTHSKESVDQMQKSRAWYTPTEETKKRVRESLKEVGSNEEGKQEQLKNRKPPTFSDESRRRLSEANAGRIHTEEAKQNMSNGQRKRFDNMTEEEYQEWYNKTFTKERNKKLSESQKGRKCPGNEKTNKDPEKIRKTAEAHRGMKRSNETRKNISKSLKGKPSNNEGSIGCYNSETGERKMVDDESCIPDSGTKGQNKNNTPKGKIWCHDPVTKEQKTCYEDEMPEGGVRGMGKRNRGKIK